MYTCLFKRKPSDCWANTPVEHNWQMLFEFYWLRSCCLSPFTSQWARRWPLCCLVALCIIGPNTIKCTFSIWGLEQWQPLRCPHAQRGPTPVTSSTWTVTLIYKQVTSATTAFTWGQLRSLYFQKALKKSRQILIIWCSLRVETWLHISSIREWGHSCAWLRKTPNDVSGETSKPFHIQTHHMHTLTHGPRVNYHHRSWSECLGQRCSFKTEAKHWFFFSILIFFFLFMPQGSVLKTCFNHSVGLKKTASQKNTYIHLAKEYKSILSMTWANHISAMNQTPFFSSGHSEVWNMMAQRHSLLLITACLGIHLCWNSTLIAETSQ